MLRDFDVAVFDRGDLADRQISLMPRPGTGAECRAFVGVSRLSAWIDTSASFVGLSNRPPGKIGVVRARSLERRQGASHRFPSAGSGSGVT